MKSNVFVWVVVGLLLFVVGCEIFQPKSDPGPDGIMGTQDDVVLRSDAELIAGSISGLFVSLGWGWIGLGLQAVAAVGTQVAAVKK